MTTTTTKYTAAHFQDPLIRALGTLTGFKANAPVSAEIVYRPIMDAMGIADEHAFGVNEASGQPQVRKWIQWAFTNLSNSGLCDRKGRGLWLLTDAGVDKARELTGTVSPTPAPVPASALASAVLAPPVVDGSGGVSLHFGDFDADTYDPDPYIRSTAISQTPCFGAWTSNTNAVCSKCSVAGSCRRAQFAQMSRIAGILAAEDAKGSAPPPPPKPATPKGAGAATPPAGKGSDGKSGKFNWNKAEPIVAAVESECAFCATKIQKGESVYWVEDPTGTDGGALAHTSHKDE